jgi:hypothetical protein
MILKQLIEDTSWEEIKESLIRVCKVSDDNFDGYMSVIQKLSDMEPVLNKTRICVEWVPPDEKFNDEGYWDVHGKDGTLQKDTDDFQFFKDCSEEFANSEVTYAIEFTPWKEWLGMEIDPETANNIELTRSDIVAQCLWEMTFCGYEEEEIQEKVDDLKKRVEDFEKMTPEEIKNNTCTLEELKERLEKLTRDKENEDESED